MFAIYAAGVEWMNQQQLPSVVQLHFQIHHSLNHCKNKINGSKCWK